MTVDAKCDVVEILMVRGRRSLSPLAWEAAFSLLLSNLFCFNPWETMGSLVEAIIGKPRRGARNERRRVVHASRYRVTLCFHIDPLDG